MADIKAEYLACPIRQVVSRFGDKWELYIPAEVGYGKFSQPGIPGGSTLIFEIELLGIG